MSIAARWASTAPLPWPQRWLAARDHVCIERLLDSLHRLVAAGHTVLVIEHRLGVIKTADWLIDLGPEGGVGRGALVAAGPPEHVAAVPHSWSGRFPRSVLDTRELALI